MLVNMNSFLGLATLVLSAMAIIPSPSPAKVTQPTPVYPKVSGKPSVIANVTDPTVSRDSCGSVRIGSNEFWTCRDTMKYDPSTGQAEGGTHSNTCGWTTFNPSSGSPNIGSGPVGANSNGSNAILQMQGCAPLQNPLLYAIPTADCGPSGICDNVTRWVLWPDSPPMVTFSDSEGKATAYTWISDAHIYRHNGTLLNPEPPCSLYKLQFNSTEGYARPVSTLVNGAPFWQSNQICYGSYGNVVMDGIAYLYGLNDVKNGTALAQVPVGSVEDLSQYQYYYNGSWTTQTPAANDSLAIIPNAGADGQGTFYYAGYFDSYIWLGQNKTAAGIAGHQGISADFWISTAPNPEGPWIEPYKIYSGPNGNVNSHSPQAHPGLLSSPNQNGIYVTWTQTYNYTVYNTPLVYIEWK